MKVNKSASSAIWKNMNTFQLFCVAFWNMSCFLPEKYHHMNRSQFFSKLRLWLAIQQKPFRVWQKIKHQTAEPNCDALIPLTSNMIETKNVQMNNKTKENC